MIRRLLVSGLLLAVCAVVWLAKPLATRGAGVELPARLTDQEFWKLSQESSEPGGYFRSENITNLTSNELWFQYVIPDLVKQARPGGVYLGVGPEQNYTYMAALKPKMAIIFDIRRGNLDLQLMYKAIFELAKDRAEFISLLFAKPRPAGLGARSTAMDLFNAFGSSATSETLYRQDLKAIEDHLTKTHGLALRADDLAGLEAVYQTFYWSGYAVRASPTYAELMTATDAAGSGRSFLATEESFAFLKDLESRNLVVPVVGDFGGPTAIRAIGKYLKAQGATVSAFYLSNVEQYLYQDGKWDAFCRSVATLPLDASSTFIRSANGGGGGGFGRGGGFVSSLGLIAAEVKQGCGG
jgi:hypothetical protein